MKINPLFFNLYYPPFTGHLLLLRSHYVRIKGISIILMAMFIVAVFYNGRQVMLTFLCVEHLFSVVSSSYLQCISAD